MPIKQEITCNMFVFIFAALIALLKQRSGYKYGRGMQ